MNAVIYCRVSSKEQLDGTSLQSQETACRDYARRHNLTVAKVFIEEGESAKFADRTQLLELLSYCKDRSRNIETLLVWKIDRFARSVEDHYAVKATLRKLGVQIVSVTEPIQSDPNGKLMETILAGFAQFDNDIRGLRSIQGMQQRLRDGIWPWLPPLGYLPPKIGKKTRPDEPDPRYFEPLRKAWQLLATGAYTKAEIWRLLRSWGVCGYRGQPISEQSVNQILANPYYAGTLRDPWTGEEYTGRHAAMVSTIEFARVQQIIRSRSNSTSHHRLNDDFPLRGQIRCPSCEMLMTGYFAQGRSQRYPYYRCFSDSCATRTRSYPANAAHDEFLEFVAETSVPHHLACSVITEVIAVGWDSTQQMRKTIDGRNDEVRRVKRQLQELISMRTARLVADDEFTIQRDQLRTKLIDLDAGSIEGIKFSLTDADIAAVATGVSNLKAAWRTMPNESKRGFVEILLPAGYVFLRVRTAEKGLLFKTLEASGRGLPYVVPLIRENANALMAEIRRLLAVIRPVEKPKSEAA